MSTFISKLRTVTLGAAHDLLDKAIDLNSPSALRQYVRDLEDALDKIRNEAAVQAGQIRTLEREQGDLQHRIDLDTQTATSLMKTGHQDLARIKGTAVLRAKADLETTTKSLDAQRVTSANIDKSVAALELKHTDMVARVRTLERLDRDTKAKEQAAGALTAAGKLVSGGADISVDDVQSRMQQRNDVATEKFSRAMGTTAVEEDPTEAANVDEFLAGLGNTKTTSA